jgi:hypothetical protein
VLYQNSTNVDFRWEFNLDNGDVFGYHNIKRYEKYKDMLQTLVTLGSYLAGYTTVNTTLYSLDTNTSNGPSSGNISFTIKDILVQHNNNDGSKANALSQSYGYRLELKLANVLETKTSDVELSVLCKYSTF